MIFPSSKFEVSKSHHSNLFVEELESRVMLSTVQVFAAGHTGQETLVLNVDGVDTTFENVGGNAATGEYQEFTYQSEDVFNPEDISIRFTNDFYDPANGIDRNLTVNRIVVDGETIFTASDSVFSIGVYEDNSMAAGFGRGSTLFTNGVFEYGQDPNSGSNLTVAALGMRSEEIFNVNVGGRFVGSFSTAGQTGMNAYQLSLNENFTPGDVEVIFVNDLYQPELGIDRNLIVDRIEVDGVVVQTESPEVFSTGTYIAGQGIVEGFLQNETLHANGLFRYSDSGVDVTPPVVTLASASDVTETGVFSSDITINITDDFQAVFPPGNLDTAISVITPDGEIVEAIELFGFNQPDGSLGIGYSFRNPTGIDFRESDNGTYRVLLNEGTIPDAAGNFANGGIIGSFIVNVSDSLQTDFIPPVATLIDNGPVTSISNDTATFFVRYEDETKIGLINDDAITVTGPNGYSETAIPVSGGGFGDNVRTRGYQMPINGSFWGVEDNGTYTVFLNPESVFDDALNAAVGVQLGTFELRLG